MHVGSSNYGIAGNGLSVATSISNFMMLSDTPLILSVE